MTFIIYETNVKLFNNVKKLVSCFNASRDFTSFSYSSHLDTIGMCFIRIDTMLCENGHVLNNLHFLRNKIAHDDCVPYDVYDFISKIKLTNRGYELPDKSYHTPNNKQNIERYINTLETKNKEKENKLKETEAKYQEASNKIQILIKKSCNTSKRRIKCIDELFKNLENNNVIYGKRKRVCTDIYEEYKQTKLIKLNK